MQYEQYITYSFFELALNALKWGAIFGLIIGFPAFIVYLIKNTPTTKVILRNSLVGGAFAGLLIGGFTPTFLAQEDNDKILTNNISKKYDTQITQMGHDFTMGNKGAPYDASNKTPHEVTISVNGESQLAYLQQDEKTNEPTLLDYDTHKPRTDILKK